MNDPILSNPDIQKLLSTADEGLARSFVQRWKGLNYRPEDSRLAGSPGISSVNRDGVQESTGFINAMKAAYLIHGVVGAPTRKVKQFLSSNDMVYDYQRTLPVSGRGVNVDEWYKKNKGSLSENMRAAYVAGDLDGITTEDGLYDALAYIGAEDAYRRELEQANGLAGFAGSMTGSLIDPGNLALTAGIGKLGSVAFGALRHAKNARLAAQITAATGKAATVAKTAGFAGRVVENVATGVASNVISETELQLIDPNRTKEDTTSTLLTGILFDSFIAAGANALSRTPIKPTTHVFIQKPKEVISLKDIEADIDAHLQAKAAGQAKPNSQLGLFDEQAAANIGKQIDALLSQTDNAIPLSDQVDALVKQAEKDANLKEQVDQLLLDYNKQREVQGELFSADALEAGIKNAVEQPAPADFIDGVKALKEYEDFAMEEMQARKAARAKAVTDGGSVPPASTEVAAVPARPDNGRGYEAYELFMPEGETTRKVMNFLDKYGQNKLLAWFAPMSKLESSKSTAFKMLLAKVYQKRLPTIGAISGEIRPGVPFELVQATTQRKKLMVDRVLGQSFRRMLSIVDPSLKNKAIELSNLPEELWPANLHQKATDYYDLVDAIRIANTFENMAGDATPLSSAQLVERGMSELRNNTHGRGAAWVDARINALGFSGKEAELKAHIAELFDEVLPVTATMRERLRNPRDTAPEKLLKSDRIDTLYQESAGIKLISHEGDEMTMNDFARFWTIITNEGESAVDPHDFNIAMARDPNAIDAAQIRKVAEAYNKKMLEVKGVGVSEADIEHVIANPLSTDSTAYRVVNTFRDFYMNTYGGFVPSVSHMYILQFQKANGNFGVRFDARRSVALRTRAMEQVELGIVLKDYLVEAGQWDVPLREATGPRDIAVNEATPDAPRAATLLDRYSTLRANRAFGVTLEGFDFEQSLPDYGFINDMKQWNLDALSAIENNIVTNHLPSMSTNADAIAKYPEILGDSLKWLEQEKKLIGEGFQHIRQRTGLELESNDVGKNIYKVAAPMARNLLLTARIFNNTVEIANSLYAVATSPFKGDMSAVASNILADMERAADRGIDRGAFLNNIEYLNDVGNSLAVRYFNETKYSDGLMNGHTTAQGMPEFSGWDKVGAAQSGPIGNVIDVAALGNFSQEFSRSIAAHSSLFQVLSKDGLIMRFDKTLDDIAGGMERAAAFEKNGLNNYWGRWASEYLSETDVREVAQLIRDDVSKEITTPKRFYLDKAFGDSTFKVVDLPEEASLAARQAIENVAMFTNNLITKEKMSMPGWLDDITGTSNPLMRLLTFWMRPSAAGFNRMFVGAAHKGSANLAGIMLTATMLSMTVDVLKAQINGKGQEKLDEINKNWVTWAARRGAWVSVFGTGGEKLVSFAFPRAGRLGGLMEAAPFAVGDMLLKGAYGVSNVARGKELTEGEANNLWRMGHLFGIPTDTLGARLLGNTGRILGVYGKENDSLDLQQQFNAAINAKEKE